jgi:hypothetical protein
MSRGERVRAEIEARYPLLRQFLFCHLHVDCLIDFDSPEQALDAALAETPPDLRQRLRRELAALLGSTEDDTRLRRLINDGFGVPLAFRKPAQAREFAEALERKLLAAPKDGVGHRREDLRG